VPAVPEMSQFVPAGRPVRWRFPMKINLKLGAIDVWGYKPSTIVQRDAGVVGDAGAAGVAGGAGGADVVRPGCGRRRAAGTARVC
jgi:hypothetical protein